MWQPCDLVNKINYLLLLILLVYEPELVLSNAAIIKEELAVVIAV